MFPYKVLNLAACESCSVIFEGMYHIHQSRLTLVVLRLLKQIHVYYQESIKTKVF